MRSDLEDAARAIEVASSVVRTAARKLANSGDLDDHQTIAYDMAHAASAVEVGRAMLDYATHGDEEASLACAFIADALADLSSRTFGREEEWGVDEGWYLPCKNFVVRYREPSFLASLAAIEGQRHLDEEFELVRATFRRFAEERVRPYADRIHRENLDVPEEIIACLAELGGFGLSIPEQYGGFATGTAGDFLGMVVATEELSWGSLGAGGSRITRPEILARALINGGTEEQKMTWLPRLADGSIMAAVAVTEPDFGSDVANLTTQAVAYGDGWLINGVKTWCTFAARANVLMLLARTNPDKSLAHRGLSLFVVEKPVAHGTGFSFTQRPLEEGQPVSSGKMEGRAIDTIGYRGMHSYEISFDGWWVPAEALVGGERGLGKGFYYQMQGFENGRLQTAARALGVMQAAYEAAFSYATQRVVFAKPIYQYELTKVKLGRMAVLIQAIRQFAYKVATLMASGAGSLEASMVKAYACRAAEWVTREAMQIHGGMGYAEEFPVSRYFVDARVLSIFEGADETLALKVIARRLLDEASV